VSGPNNTKRILVVDDEPLMREFLGETLTRQRYRVKVVGDGEEALSLLKRDRYALVLSDLRMPERDGLSLLRAAREVSPETRFVIMTGYATIDNAVEAMKLGAADYLTKPFSADQAEELVRRVLEESGNADPDNGAGVPAPVRVLVGDSPQMQEVRSLIRLAASTGATVLVTGETGTGKELVARAIHEQSTRSSRPLVRVNCAAVPESLFESELFGHERGAFTGAIRQKKGRFELAHGGTLLMDEVSEMVKGLQAKLLRVLQEKEYERVGGTSTLRADVRVIATTNKDLAQEIRDGRFRSDLYYRLSVFPIEVPPLRERMSDVPQLVEHFLRLHCERNGLGPKELSAEAMESLHFCGWPGNVRQLENSLERAAILARGPVIGPECFPSLNDTSLDSDVLPGQGQMPAGQSLKEMERTLLLRTLTEVGGNRSLAASRLGISTRTLRNKLHEMGRMDFLKSGPEPGGVVDEDGGKNLPSRPERVSSPAGSVATTR
jgi:DNA-binding NtrC family response regulator